MNDNDDDHISKQSWQMGPCECLFSNFTLVIWQGLCWLVIWQGLCWRHITICWAMCIASVIPSSRGTTTSARFNNWTFIDTQLFTAIWTLVPNIFCTVCTKWNATASAKTDVIILEGLNRWCFLRETIQNLTPACCIHNMLILGHLYFIFTDN